MVDSLIVNGGPIEYVKLDMDMLLKIAEYAAVSCTADLEETWRIDDWYIPEKWGKSWSDK